MNNVLYNRIYSALYNQDSCLALENFITLDEIYYAIKWVMRDNPDIFWFDFQYEYDERRSSIYFHYTFSANRIKIIQQSIDDVINNDFCLEYVKTLSLKQQVAYIYKWLITYCNYNVNSAYNQSIYSVFVSRNSVCTGYAKAAQYLFGLLDIKSNLVFGRLNNDKENGRHCWNMVNIDNQHYHFDASLGDGVLDRVSIMADIDQLFKEEGINYNFLCVSTDEMLKTRSIEDLDALPMCISSWPKDLVCSLSKIEIKGRNGIKGCLLSSIGCSADIYLCAKEKNTVLKIFRPNTQSVSENEYRFLLQTEGCLHTLQYVEEYTDLSHNIIAIEQATPVLDLLCSRYYELSLKGLVKMTKDIARAWMECRDNGVIYRDIHIGNIYRSNDGNFKFGDFADCARSWNDNVHVGNQIFMAPETSESGIYTEKSAVYSISMVMYFIMNGLCPALSDTRIDNEGQNGWKLKLPVACNRLPVTFNEQIEIFFSKALAVSLDDRFAGVDVLMGELERLTCLCGNADYRIHEDGVRHDYESASMTRFANSVCYSMKGIKSNDVEASCRTSCMIIDELIDSALDCENSTSDCKIPSTGRIEAFANTKGVVNDNCESCVYDDKIEQDNVGGDAIDCNKVVSSESDWGRVVAGLNDLSFVVSPESKSKESFWKKIFGRKKYDDVYSSIFAPAQIKKKSHLLVQVYLHLLQEIIEIKSHAAEIDKNAGRRNNTPLPLKLKKGDKVDVYFQIKGETCLMSEHKSITWLGSYSTCYFEYFVSKDIDVNNLSCNVLLSVNNIPVGDLRFITEIVECPKNVNADFIVHKFNKIFISYSHKDESRVKFLAEGFKLMNADYFFDRHYLKAGDLFPIKIQEYIKQADLFILCWSVNSAESEYVEKERKQALARAFSNNQPTESAELTIYPIGIEPYTELPSDMKAYYHFPKL